MHVACCGQALQKRQIDVPGEVDRVPALHGKRALKKQMINILLHAGVA
jgi:hypothetical protein